MKLQYINAQHPHLYLYLKNEELFVWSVPKKELYGFEGFGAALFLYMEEFYTKKTEASVYHYFNTVPKKILQTLIEQIATILNDVTPSNNVQKQNNIQKKSLSTKFSYLNRYYLQLNQENFILELEDTTLDSLLMPSLRHLQTPNTTSDFTITITNNTKGDYEIYVNGNLEDCVTNPENLLPVLYDRIRIYHYQKNSFLVALHSAVVTYNNTALIFPGVSGAGKSTLTAYLMYKGFTLFSDELTIISDTATITPLPLAVSLKEGSWHVMEPFVDIKSIPSHLRFDGQKIKLLIPPKIEHKKLKPKKIIFIFPQFIQGSTTQLKKLSLIEILNIFIDTGYHLVDSDDFQKVFLWLKLLSETERYSLRYSNIQEAHSILKEVLL